MSKGSGDSDREDAAQASDEPASASVWLVLLLILIAAAGWWLYLRPSVEVEAGSIREVALELGAWRGEDIPIDETVERMLRADAQVQRRYQDPTGDVVWLYVGYYGTARGGRPEHTPWVCYPSAGWTIRSQREIALLDPDEHDETGTRNELVVEQDGRRRLVHFWYATHRSVGVASETALTLDHLAGRLSPSGRADGALVRLSTPIRSGDVAVARARLDRFSDPLIRELRRRWPRES